MLDAVRLGEMSDGTFAMTGRHDRLYLAWTGTDRHLNLAWSPDAREIIGKQWLAQQSYKEVPASQGTAKVGVAPALAASGEQLHLAWMAADQRLAGLRGWFSDVRYISILTDPENPHGAPVRLEEARSAHAPALCAHQGSLVLAWTGTDGHINLLARPESPHGEPVRLDPTWSQCMPALCSHQGSLVLAWTGTDGYINLLTGPENPHGEPVRLQEARSQCAPALCSYQGSLVLAWRGTDRHLNLARLR